MGRGRGGEGVGWGRKGLQRPGAGAARPPASLTPSAPGPSLMPRAAESPVGPDCPSERPAAKQLGGSGLRVWALGTESGGGGEGEGGRGGAGRGRRGSDRGERREGNEKKKVFSLVILAHNMLLHQF